MVVWLASYPRSGNTFFRILLHHLYGRETHSIYSLAALLEWLPEDTRVMNRLTGQRKVTECDLDTLHTDPELQFVKTHDLPCDDHAPALLIVRDGRDALVSYARFILKTESGIDEPEPGLLDLTLKHLIMYEPFGGWGRNVMAWADRAGTEAIIRYEDLIRDPVGTATGALQCFGFTPANAFEPPSFETLHAAIPWFFRRGKSGAWKEEMPKDLQRLFLDKNSTAMERFGYEMDPEPASVS